MGLAAGFGVVSLGSIPAGQSITAAAPSSGSSSLAAGAVRGGASALPELANGDAARSARQSLPAVNAIIELEIAGLAPAVHVVPQRRSALGDGFGQRGTDRVEEAPQARTPQTPPAIIDSDQQPKPHSAQRSSRRSHSKRARTMV